MKIKLTIGSIILQADLLDNNTAKAIYNALPLESSFHIWGKEFYFPVPVNTELENGQQTVEVGDLAFWPPGNAFCIFFGPTPISEDDKPRAASAVTVFGKVQGDVSVLNSVEENRISVEKMDYK